jgi:SAM-dependent methyltransferase
MADSDHPDDNTNKSDQTKRVHRMISDALSGGSPTDWFEEVYSGAVQGTGFVPWARMRPDSTLVNWLALQAPRGEDKQALIVGCGLGDDAEAVAKRGFEVTAFDISETAIASARVRFPDSKVDYQVADLFALPPEWAGRFDLVVESRTIQALPWDYTEAAVKAIAAQVAPAGVLLVLCMGREPKEDRRGIPWPLSRTELTLFEQAGLREESFQVYQEGGQKRFKVVYRRI